MKLATIVTFEERMTDDQETRLAQAGGSPTHDRSRAVQVAEPCAGQGKKISMECTPCLNMAGLVVGK
jgi:hypothetical protein